MKIDELVSRTKDSFQARVVYAEPFEQDGLTLIAAARVAGGFGGGSGSDHQGQDGEGAGYGLNARPVGAYVVKGGSVCWRPAVDVNRLITTVGAVAIAALVVAGRVVKARSCIH